MRIRTIKPEFFIHDEIFELEKETGLPIRIAYVGLWCAADREGRFQWEPRRLGALILPYDQVDFSRVLDALATRGFLVRYAWGTREFGVIPSFTRHQVINNRESASTLPDPEKCDKMGPPTRAPRVDDACPTPLVQDQGEGKGREGKGKEQRAQAPRFSPDEFDHLLANSQKASPEFLQLWHQWLESRHSRRKRVTEHAAKMQIAEMHAAGVPAGIAAMRKAIAGDYQGLHLTPPAKPAPSAPSPRAGWSLPTC